MRPQDNDARAINPREPRATGQLALVRPYLALSTLPGSSRMNGVIASPVTVAAVHLRPALDRAKTARRIGANTVDISSDDR
jgi:hypothetical protein